MYSLLSSRVLFNISHLKYFAASGNFYTSPNNVLEIFLYHLYHFLCQANLKKLAVFWTPRLYMLHNIVPHNIAFITSVHK